MTKRSSYNSQFKAGYFPQEHWDESSRQNGHEPDSPSTVRKRQGIARGAQTAANPGLIAWRSPKTASKRGT